MFKHKGYGLLLPTIACAALIGGVGLSVTKMSNVSVGAILSTKTKYVGQQYALNTADKYCRLHNYASLTGIEKRKIDGSDDYYEEVIVNNSTVPIVSGSTEVSTVAAKDITVNVYHKESDRMPLVSTIKLYRTDPATFEPGFNMVANDATSTNEYQAMSANAFRELLNSKISDDMTADTTDVAMSANASKLYINSVLKDYALADDTVSVENDAGAGSPFRGVYIDKNGVARPIDVVVRGNKTADTDPWVLLPHLNNGTWELNKIRMSQLNKKDDQESFTVKIVSGKNQTITVTTDDGVKHTQDFTATKGTKWTASIKADTGYNPGKLISTSGTITGATTVSATEATIKTFEFKIIAPKNETITVTMGDGTVYTVKGTDTESVTKDDLKIAYGTKWSATVSAEDGYTAGALSTASGTVTAPTTVSAGAAAENEANVYHKWELVTSDTFQKRVITVNTFESMDDDYYFTFTTCSKAKYIYIQGRALNADGQDDTISCEFNLKNNKGKELEIGYGTLFGSIDGVCQIAIIKISPNTSYKLMFESYSGLIDTYNDQFFVQEISESEITIDEENGKAYNDSLQKVEELCTFKYIPYYDFTN